MVPKTSSQYVLKNWKPGELLVTTKTAVFHNTEKRLDATEWISKKAGEHLIFLGALEQDCYFTIKFLAKDRILYESWHKNWAFNSEGWVVHYYTKIEQ